MDVIESLKWRYATKKFDSTKKLNAEELKVLKEAFNLTATSYGLQALKLVIVENKEIRNQLLPHCFKQNQVVDASHLFIICYADEFNGNDVEQYFNRVVAERKTPEKVIKPFKDFLINEFNNKSTEEKHSSFAKQTYIALGNLLTVCALHKIDTCPMEGFIPKKIDEILNLEAENLKSALLLPVGFRAKDDFMAQEKKVRKPLAEVVIEI